MTLGGVREGSSDAPQTLLKAFKHLSTVNHLIVNAEDSWGMAWLGEWQPAAMPALTKLEITVSA